MTLNDIRNDEIQWHMGINFVLTKAHDISIHSHKYIQLHVIVLMKHFNETFINSSLFSLALVLYLRIERTGNVCTLYTFLFTDILFFLCYNQLALQTNLVRTLAINLQCRIQFDVFLSLLGITSRRQPAAGSSQFHYVSSNSAAGFSCRHSRPSRRAFSPCRQRKFDLQRASSSRPSLLNFVFSGDQDTDDDDYKRKSENCARCNDTPETIAKKQREISSNKIRTTFLNVY